LTNNVKDEHKTRGATLIHGMTVHLAGYQHIPGNWRMPTRHRILSLYGLWLCPQRSIWWLVFYPILSSAGSL